MYWELDNESLDEKRIRWQKESEEYMKRQEEIRQKRIALTPERYKKIVEVMLDWESSLSDGYKDYCEYCVDMDLYPEFEDDYVLGTLIAMAQEMIDDNL